MILVTGATGDVGGEVVRQLVHAGEVVRVLARDPARAAKLGPAVEVVRGDLLQPGTLADAFSGATKVFLMAGAEDLPAVAEHATAAALRGGVRHVVLLSSAAASREPLMTIGKWHLAAEQQLEAAGLAWTMLRPGNFASNTLRWAPMIKAQGAVFAPAGVGKSAPIDPYDIASVAVKALTAPGHEGHRYLLTGDELLGAAEQVEIIGAALGKTLRLVEVPAAAARAGMLKSGMNEVLADALLEMVGHVRSDREALRTSTVLELTGSAPRTFAAWVRAHLSAFA